MSVIGPSCSPGSDTSPPCAGAPKAKTVAGIAGAAAQAETSPQQNTNVKVRRPARRFDKKS